MDEIKAKPVEVEPPRGFHPARVDEKGRLKLPSIFQEYLEQLGEKRVFITTLDESTARIYTSSVWAANERFFADPGEAAAEAEAVAFVANHYGANSDLDNQGRVLVPQELRKELGIENQPVWLGHEQGAISVYGETVYQQKLAAMRSQLPIATRELKKKGLLK